MLYTIFNPSTRQVFAMNVLTLLFLWFTVSGACNSSAEHQAIPQEIIRNKLGLYATSLDARNFAQFSNVFAPNVVARVTFPPPFEVLTNLTEMIEAIQYGLGSKNTQHKLSSIYVDIQSSDQAFSITYLQATYFSAPLSGIATGVPNQNIVDTFGQYEDQWTLDPEGNWLIVNRNLTTFVSRFSPFLWRLVTDVTPATCGQRHAPHPLRIDKSQIR
jgi:hypothetical protein